MIGARRGVFWRLFHSSQRVKIGLYFLLFAAQIIAHRGASYDAPENTVLALKLGYRQNADAGECDIHLTKDGKIVVMHDHDTARTGGNKLVIKETDLATLRQVDVAQWGKWKDKGLSEKVPLLEEALAVIPYGKQLFIEIKCGPEILPELERILKRAGKKPAQTPIMGSITRRSGKPKQECRNWR